MNLKQLVNKKTLENLYRLDPRLVSFYPNYYVSGSSSSTRKFSTVAVPFLDASVKTPKFLHNSFIFKRYFHAAQHSRLSELGLNPKPNSNDDDDEVDENMNEFLSRFVHVMRGKLLDVYPDSDKQTIDGMLLIIVGKVLAEMEKGSIERMLSGEGGADASSQDFSDDLWRTVWEMSNLVLEDMEKERKKEKMKAFLQDEEVKEMCRFAGEIGIRGDMLRELRYKWAREKMEESEFYASLEKLREEEKAMEKEESDATKPNSMGEMAVTGEEKQKVITLPKRHGKIKYKIYGLDLSDPKWIEVADKIHERGEIIWPQEPKPIQGKSKLVVGKILSLKAEDDPSHLLSEWAELHQPNRLDWINLLDQLKEQNPKLHIKVAEHLLSEKSFQPNVRDFSVLIDTHAKENRFEDAERILKKMNENGILPDILTGTVLLHMYSNAGNFNLAIETFQSLTSMGFEPDEKIYKTMISVYAHAGLPELGESLMRRMETKRTNLMEELYMKPAEDLYMALIRSYFRCGNSERAYSLINGLTSGGCKLSLELYSLIIEDCAQASDPDKARKYFDDMIKDRIKPDDRCVAGVIAAYEKKNSLDMALDLLLQLEKDGFEPGSATLTVLIDWFGKLQLVDEAEELLGKIAEQGETPPFKIHVSLCDMYAKAGNEKKALQALGVLEAKKEQLEPDDFERIIMGLNSGGFLKEARRIHALMEAQGYRASERVRVTLAANFGRFR